MNGQVHQLGGPAPDLNQVAAMRQLAEAQARTVCLQLAVQSKRPADTATDVVAAAELFAAFINVT